MNSSDLTARNSHFFDALWANTYLTSPSRFNTWPVISSLLPGAAMRLEVGPGLRPRLPVAGTHFIDISPPVIARLNAGGAIARCGEITGLPFDAASFDLVLACDVIEHVADDRRAFGELCRVLKPGGHMIFSVPLHPEHWTEFDDHVGHARRYTPDELSGLIANHGLVVEKSAIFGMQSNSPRLLRYAVWGLNEHPVAAWRAYNWLFLPLGMLLQKRLKFATGLMDLADVHEVLVVCRRSADSVCCDSGGGAACQAVSGR